MSAKGRQPTAPNPLVLNPRAAFAQTVSVMTSGRHRPSSPVILPTARVRPRARRSPGDELLGKGALEAPMPGALLVLLSRLHRSEEARTEVAGKAGG